MIDINKFLVVKNINHHNRNNHRHHIIQSVSGFHVCASRIQALALAAALRAVFTSLASGTSAWRRFSLWGVAREALPTPPRHGRTQIKVSRSSKWMRTIFCGRWTSRIKAPEHQAAKTLRQLRRLLKSHTRTKTYTRQPKSRSPALSTSIDSAASDRNAFSAASADKNKALAPCRAVPDPSDPLTIVMPST